MKIKRSIFSIVLLSVYSIVLAHNFVPHEHHSNFVECDDSCSTHNEIINEECCTSFHSHEQTAHKHLHCHFEVKLVLSKLINVSPFYFSENFTEITVYKHNIKINRFYFLQKIPEPQCRDVSLRAPPLFS